jgi:hypothetical protein
MAALKFLRRHTSRRVCTLPALTFHEGSTFIARAFIELAVFALFLTAFTAFFRLHAVRRLALLTLLLVGFAALAGLPGLRRDSGRTHQHYFAFAFSDAGAAGNFWRFGLNNPMAHDRPSDDTLDAVDFDAPVDDALIDHHIVGDVLRHVDQVHVTLAGRIIGTKAWCQNAAFFHKRKPAWVDVCVSLSRPKPDADTETYPRRQRGPANPPGRVTPGHPGWGPHPIGDPVPAVIARVVPATIMEWGPAPIVVRYPRPTIIGIDPAAVRVGTPAGGHAAWHPRTAVLWYRDPVAVRGQRLVKDINIFNVEFVSRSR